jgi:hypothetical protein
MTGIQVFDGDGVDPRLSALLDEAAALVERARWTYGAAPAPTDTFLALYARRDRVPGYPLGFNEPHGPMRAWLLAMAEALSGAGQVRGRNDGVALEKLARRIYSIAWEFPR